MARSFHLHGHWNAPALGGLRVGQTLAGLAQALASVKPEPARAVVTDPG
jgi:hypothetical protein